MALFTQTSIGPSCVSTSSAARSIWSKSATSVGIGMHRWPKDTTSTGGCRESNVAAGKQRYVKSISCEEAGGLASHPGRGSRDYHCSTTCHHAPIGSRIKDSIEKCVPLCVPLQSFADLSSVKCKTLFARCRPSDSRASVLSRTTSLAAGSPFNNAFMVLRANVREMCGGSGGTFLLV